MGSFLDFVLGCILFACIAVAFIKIAFYCFPIIDKARMSSREGIPHPERLEIAAILAFNLLLGAAGAALFYRGLYWLSDPWLGDTLVDDTTMHTLVAALSRTIQELCLIILWVLSVTACVCWIFYTIAAIWEITLPSSTSTSGAVPDPATDGTVIDLESQAGCTIQATELYAGDVVHVRNDTERPDIGEDTVGSGDSYAALSKLQETKPQLQAEQVSQLIWSAEEKISPSQSSKVAAYTPSTSPYSHPRNPLDGCSQSTGALSTSETVTLADVMIQHLKSCSWVQSVGETWHDIEACERRSSQTKSENEPPKNASGAQQPIARTHVVQNTSEPRIETTLKNTSGKGSPKTSTATANIITKATGEVGTGTASGPSIGAVRSATGRFGKLAQYPLSKHTKILQTTEQDRYALLSHNTASRLSLTVSIALEEAVLLQTHLRNTMRTRPPTKTNSIS
ncbi:MAG: hypothetical protein LQ347_005036 [Umbilicaria vellea]|nr:MAG: hypothetical protein LQ347_005036 [Umbilicaria vellea]